MRKITPYNIIKGVRYLKHFGLKQFLIRLDERLEPEDVPYKGWYEHYVPTGEELNQMRQEKWKDPVTFSIVVPVYRTPEKPLTDMLDSVLAQVYPYFELCIVNADPSDEKVAAILQRYGKRDRRIRIKDLESNLGIAGNTNKGIEMARGSYIAFLDHDDMISPAALFLMARYIKRCENTGMLYTDEDKISFDGSEHFQHHLKPDFNLDLLRSNNYICHFLTVQKDVAYRAGLLDDAFNGAQDYDFIFRCAEVCLREKLHIGHVPEILYHWRVSASSTADNPMSKEYAYEAGKRAIAGNLRRMNTPGEVELLKDYGFYRVHYSLTSHPLVSIIIPNKDEKDTLKKCIESIINLSTYDKYEVIIAENNSTTSEIFDYYREIEGSSGIRVINWNDEFNYSAINNYAFKEAKGEFIICLNNDTVVISPDWIQEMLGICLRSEVAACGARLIYPDNTIQHAGIAIGIGGVAASLFTDMKREKSGYMHKASLLQDLSAVTAACMMVRADVWKKLGGFDEKLSVAFNDVDFCLRMRQNGYLVVYDPYVELYHCESKTRGAEDSKKKVRRFQSEIEFIRTRWTKILTEGDPCYNKNLSLKKWNYSLKSGERMRWKK